MGVGPCESEVSSSSIRRNSSMCGLVVCEFSRHCVQLLVFWRATFTLHARLSVVWEHRPHGQCTLYPSPLALTLALTLKTASLGFVRQGDGRTYKLTATTRDARDGVVWQAELPQLPAHQWVDVEVRVPHIHTATSPN